MKDQNWNPSPDRASETITMSGGIDLVVVGDGWI